MSLPVVRQKDAAQIRMIIKDHPKQIVGFALVPIRAAPHWGDAGYVRVILVEDNLQSHPVKLCGREQMIVDFKARLFFRTAIETAQVRKKIEFQARGAFQEGTGG